MANRKKSSSSSLVVWVVILIVGLLVIIGTSRFFGNPQSTSLVQKSVTPTTSPTVMSPASVTTLGLTLVLPVDAEILSKTTNGVVIGRGDTYPIPYLTIAKKNSIDLHSIQYCSQKEVYPCLYQGSLRGLPESVQDTTISGKTAKSFYVNTGGRGKEEHVIQVAGEFEARMKLLDDTMDQVFKDILESIVFTK